MTPSRMDYAKQATAQGSVAERNPEIAERRAGLSLERRSLRGSELFGHAYHRLLLVADAIALTMAIVATLLITNLAGAPVQYGGWVATVIVLAPAWVLIAYHAGLYGQVERRLSFDYVTELAPTAIAVTIWCWALVMVGSVTSAGGPNVFGPMALWFLAIPLILACRAGARAIAAKRPWFRRSVALIGDLGMVETLRQRIERHPEWGLEVGFRVTRRPDSETWDMWGRRPELGDQGELLESEETSPNGMVRLVKRMGIDRVIIAGGSGTLDNRIAVAHTMLDRGVAVDFVSGGPETFYGTSITQHLEGMTLMSSRPSHPRPLDRILKRALDVVLSSALLLASSPLLLYAAVRIKRDSPGPVLFRQERSGQDEEPFEVLKLRTMYDGAHEQREALRKATAEEGNDDVLFKLDRDPRVTKVGAWLRSTSLDELPQLWNVLRGDMSMVGPRPLVPEEADRASGMYTARFRVKPGIAGPWQAEGRSEIPFEDMLRLDYSYVAGWSMLEDLKLLLRTFSAVVMRKGAK